MVERPEFLCATCGAWFRDAHVCPEDVERLANEAYQAAWEALSAELDTVGA